MSDHVRIWCLRHGESENVTAGIAGAVLSAPLTGRGRHQAIQAARALAGEPISGLYSSTALRARQTAQLLAARSGLEVSGG
ncbi:MAG TPA: histidine phosphatase family protein [Streptosporangiaceae bacterium]